MVEAVPTQVGAGARAAGGRGDGTAARTVRVQLATEPRIGEGPTARLAPRHRLAVGARRAVAPGRHREAGRVRDLDHQTVHDRRAPGPSSCPLIDPRASHRIAHQGFHNQVHIRTDSALPSHHHLPLPATHRTITRGSNNSTVHGLPLLLSQTLRGRHRRRLPQPPEASSIPIPMVGSRRLRQRREDGHRQCSTVAAAVEDTTAAGTMVDGEGGEVIGGGGGGGHKRHGQTLGKYQVPFVERRMKMKVHKKLKIKWNRSPPVLASCAKRVNLL